MRRLSAPLRLWCRLGLSAQFMIASIGLMLVILSLSGVTQSWWVTRSLMASNAEMACVYMEAVIEPHVQANSGAGLTEAEQALIQGDVDVLMSKSGIRAVTIWRPDGTVIFSTNRSLIGQRFESDEVREAAAGGFSQDFIDSDEHNGAFRDEHGEIVEIYLPLRNKEGKIVAVGEFYQSLSFFRDRLAKTFVGSWSILIFFSLLGILTLFLLVSKAAKTIKRQRLSIRRQARNTLRYRREVEMLRARADQSRRHAAQASEMLLSRIGAEIHDGPIQTLTLAMLQVGHPQGRAESSAGPPPPAVLLKETVSQLRSMSAGLILPELENLDLEETIHLVVGRHERLTGTKVRTAVAPMPETSLEMRACIYRVVQEALNNAARHAGGLGQSVDAQVYEETLKFTIEDNGPGLTEPVEDLGRPRLGLLSSRHRVQTFGGTITLHSQRGHGTRVVAAFPIETTSRRNAGETSIQDGTQFASDARRMGWGRNEDVN